MYYFGPSVYKSWIIYLFSSCSKRGGVVGPTLLGVRTTVWEEEHHLLDLWMYSCCACGWIMNPHKKKNASEDQAEIQNPQEMGSLDDTSTFDKLLIT